MGWLSWNQNPPFHQSKYPVLTPDDDHLYDYFNDVCLFLSPPETFQKHIQTCVSCKTPSNSQTKMMKIHPKIRPHPRRCRDRCKRCWMLPTPRRSAPAECAVFLFGSLDFWGKDENNKKHHHQKQMRKVVYFFLFPFLFGRAGGGLSVVFVSHFLGVH